MKLLIDMNLSPRWVDIFVANHIDAVHWSDIGTTNAPDIEIMNYAQIHGYTVFTHDLDFGAILASTRAGKPSVV
jgi:predicted nuclease of predicted toxin-antitoxin system